MFENMDTGELLVTACSVAIGIVLFMVAQFRSIRSRVWDTEQRIIAKIDSHHDKEKENINSIHDDLKDRIVKNTTGIALIRQKLKINGSDDL